METVAARPLPQMPGTAWRRTEAWRRVVRIITNSTVSTAGGHADRFAGRSWTLAGAPASVTPLVLDPAGSAVEVDVFESDSLPAHWSRLDEFEGPGYARVATTVATASGHFDAFIYVLRSEPTTS